MERCEGEEGLRGFLCLKRSIESGAFFVEIEDQSSEKSLIGKILVSEGFNAKFNCGMFRNLRCWFVERRVGILIEEIDWKLKIWGLSSGKVWCEDLKFKI